MVGWELAVKLPPLLNPSALSTQGGSILWTEHTADSPGCRTLGTHIT